MDTGKRALQIAVAVLAITPVAAGLAGLLIGPDFFQLDPPWPRDLDSRFRYLSGVLFMMGLGWWSCVPAIERKAERFRVLAALTLTGGLRGSFPCPSSENLPPATSSAPPSKSWPCRS